MLTSRDEPSRPDCWKFRLVRDLEKTALVKAMAGFHGGFVAGCTRKEFDGFCAGYTYKVPNDAFRMNLVSRNPISNELCHI